MSVCVSRTGRARVCEHEECTSLPVQSVRLLPHFFSVEDQHTGFSSGFSLLVSCVTIPFSVFSFLACNNQILLLSFSRFSGKNPGISEYK